MNFELKRAKVRFFFDICKGSWSEKVGKRAILFPCCSFLPTCGVFVGYSWGIYGIFICIGYVSVMYRLCVGYMSKEMRRKWGKK